MTTNNDNKFEAIMKAPVFMTTTDLKGEIHWREENFLPRNGSEYDSDEDSMPDIVNCDRCDNEGLPMFFTSYEDPDVQICVSCYKTLREIVTPQLTLLNAKEKIRKMMSDFITNAHIRNEEEAEAQYQRNVFCWNLANPGTPCPFISPTTKK